MTTDNETLLAQAIELALRNVREQGGRPFAALVVKDGRVVATGVNEILATGDPTAHAELQAIRAAARALGTARLDGCTVYASGHPCPMCLAAMHLTGIGDVYYAFSNEDGERFGLSTASIYAELRKPLTEQAVRLHHLPPPPHADGAQLYETWQAARDQ